jgi:hypothetical protein
MPELEEIIAAGIRNAIGGHLVEMDYHRLKTVEVDADKIAAYIAQRIKEVDEENAPAWERQRWLRLPAPDGRVWMETSSPREIRDGLATHPDHTVLRLWRREWMEQEWRPVTPAELEADCVAEAEFYRKRRRQ